LEDFKQVFDRQLAKRPNRSSLFVAYLLLFGEKHHHISIVCLLQVVVQWGDQLPSSFNVEISSNPAVSWDSVVQQPAAAGAQQVDLGSTTQWLRIYCNGGCSIQELQVGMETARFSCGKIHNFHGEKIC
jgi:hypothetical protein